MEETLDNREPVSHDSTSEQEKRSDSPSPRGVLEVPVSGSSESDNTVALSSPEKLSAQRALFGESNGPQWRNLIDNFKWKSVRKFSTIPLLGVYDSSRKNLMNKLGSNRSAEEEIDYGDLIVPKLSWRNFTRAELVAATDNYSPDKLLGVGGHAEVYKGCLRDGEVVAVKRITKKEKNEKDRAGDFLSELGIIAHINHPNAAKLIGYSTEDGLHLVLKFSPNGSLASALHGAGECLPWNKRFKVAVGIADGLQYLHHECPRRVIHRDITASNILLTHDYEPQISDFGLAKWLPEKWVQHVVNPIEGTFGYMAPEYFMHGIVDEKTDVFAFGVLLLELITGRRAVDSYRNSLVVWAKSMLENEQVEELVDPRLGEDYNLSEMKRVIFVVLACIHHSPSTRPNMTQVVKILKGQCAQTEMRHESFGRRHIIFDSCELEGYTSMNYLSDLNRHMQLVME